MNFTRQEYHTDRDREIYLSSAGWNRSAYTTDALRYAFEALRDSDYYYNSKFNVTASESELWRDVLGNCMWNWFADEEKEMNAASNSELGDFLFEGVA